MNCTNIFFNGLVHLLYPEVCAGCGSDLVNGTPLCLECISELPLTGFGEHADNPVEKIFWGRLPLIAATSLVYFTKQSVMQNLIHQLKYKGNKEVGEYFGRLIGESMNGSERFAAIDAIVPLPLYFKREKKRGYNQAQVIAEGIAEIMGLPVISSAVSRRRRSETQTRKGRRERWENIEGKFELINANKITGMHILLVDDVITTGATLEACGHALLKAHGVRLSVASLAYTSL